MRRRGADTGKRGAGTGGGGGGKEHPHLLAPALHHLGGPMTHQCNHDATGGGKRGVSTDDPGRATPRSPLQL